MDVPCIKCGACGSVKVNIECVDGGASFYCDSCDEAFCLADIKLVVESWSKLIPWLESHPAYVKADK